MLTADNLPFKDGRIVSQKERGGHLIDVVAEFPERGRLLANGKPCGERVSWVYNTTDGGFYNGQYADMR